MTVMDHVPEGLRTVGDQVSGLAAIGALLELMPSIAGLLSAIWFAVRLYDRFRGRHHND